VTEPRIVPRLAQPYVAVEESVPMNGLAGAVDRGFGTVFGWLAAHDIEPTGAPLVRYLEVDMAAGLVVQLCLPVSTDIAADGPVRSGVLPAGDYVTLLYLGPYDGLVEANAQVLSWGSDQGLQWAMDGDRWRGRIEQYLTDPRAEPDPATWQTEVAYLIEPADRTSARHCVGHAEQTGG
jgi:effector-binding domain-containing protein